MVRLNFESTTRVVGAAGIYAIPFRRSAGSDRLELLEGNGGGDGPGQHEHSKSVSLILTSSP